MPMVNLGSATEHQSNSNLLFRAHSAASPGHRYANANDANSPLAVLWAVLYLFLVQMCYDAYNHTVAYRLPDKLHGAVVKAGFMPHVFVNKSTWTSWWALQIQIVSNKVQDQLVLEAMLALMIQVMSITPA